MSPRIGQDQDHARRYHAVLQDGPGTWLQRPASRGRRKEGLRQTWRRGRQMNRTIFRKKNLKIERRATAQIVLKISRNPTLPKLRKKIRETLT